jgi:hypothetical protein
VVFKFDIKDPASCSICGNFTIQRNGTRFCIACSPQVWEEAVLLLFVNGLITTSILQKWLGIETKNLDQFLIDNESYIIGLKKQDYTQNTIKTMLKAVYIFASDVLNMERPGTGAENIKLEEKMEIFLDFFKNFVDNYDKNIGKDI